MRIRRMGEGSKSADRLSRKCHGIAAQKSLKVEVVTLGWHDSEVSVKAWHYKGQRSAYFD